MSILELDTKRAAVTFTVTGLPVPKGSLKAFVPKGWSRPVLTSTSKGLKDWASLVRYAAQQHVTTCATGPMAVTLAFALPRPKALPKTKDRAHITKPDLDKLTRAVLDALTGTAWGDDSQVVALTCTKRYAALEAVPGVVVSLREACAEPSAPAPSPERAPLVPPVRDDRPTSVHSGPEPDATWRPSPPLAAPTSPPIRPASQPTPPQAGRASATSEP